MSKFFDNYNSILEKSLQKVRLKVDPHTKYAEDFGQYDGYVGYILAETDESIDFFCKHNTVVTIPRAALVNEGWAGDAAKGAMSGVGNFARGLAGQKTNGSFGGALGSIARQGISAAGNVASTAYLGKPIFGQGGNKDDQTKDGSGAAPGSASKTHNPMNLPKGSGGVAHNVKDVKGAAAVNLFNTNYLIAGITTASTPAISIAPNNTGKIPTMDIANNKNILGRLVEVEIADPKNASNTQTYPGIFNLDAASMQLRFSFVNN